jgi:molybdopterin molybdotransferase
MIVEAAIPGGGLERAGSHISSGSRLVSAGRRLRPATIGLLASAGIGHVAVARRPRVRCLLTGRNVGHSGAQLPIGHVHDSNGPLLIGLIARDGGLSIEARWVDRTITAISDALAQPDADVFLVIGSTGNGTDDYAAAALAEAGELAVHGVALRPGDTSGMGRTTAGTLVFLLSGAPAACLWGYEIFAD